MKVHHKFVRIAALVAVVFGLYMHPYSFGVQVDDSKFIVGAVDDFEARSVQPLTEYDRIVSRNGHFYAGLDNANQSAGRRVRFFGVNLALSANFPTPEYAEKLSRKLASLGVNIVRLHAIDQPAGMDRAQPNGVLVDAAHTDLDPVALNYLDNLIKDLNNHGIYVDLNLHVNHSFPAMNAGDYVPPQSKPLYIFDRKMIEWQKEYVKKLAVGLALKARPGLALVEVSNESTLLDNWQENRLPSLIKGQFASELDGEWSVYKRSHPEIDAKMDLPLGRAGLNSEQARIAARFFLFMDKRYIDEISKVVRTSIRSDIPISGTQIIHSGRWKHGGFANFTINESANYTDAHFYVDHYYFPHRQWDWRNWRISNNWIGDNLVDTISNTAFARYAGKPFVVSEFNQPWPNDKESGALPVVTQFAASQDWDGLILYTYAHDREWDNLTPSDFSLRGDWTKLVQFRQCAMYFRNVLPDVTLPEEIVKIGKDEQINGSLQNISGELLKYLVKNSKLDPRVALDRQIKATDDESVGKDSQERVQGSSYMSYDEGQRQIVFGSSYAEGFSGYIKNQKTVNLSVMSLTRNQGDSDFFTAFLTSQDELPLAYSRDLLLTLPGATYGSINGHPIGLEKTFLGSEWWTIPSDDPDSSSGNLYRTEKPVWMGRIKTQIRIKLAARDVEIYGLNEYGRRVHSSAEKVVNGEVVLHANEDDGPAYPAFEIVVTR